MDTKYDSNENSSTYAGYVYIIYFFMILTHHSINFIEPQSDCYHPS